MNEVLYKRLVYLVDLHRTWIEVVSADAVRTHTIVRNGRLCDILCRMLVLRAFAGRPPYERGMEWQVAQGDVLRAIQRLRHTDADFAGRMARSPSLMTKEDAERIVFIATQGIVRLRLTDIPIYMFSSL